MARQSGGSTNEETEREGGGGDTERNCHDLGGSLFVFVIVSVRVLFVCAFAFGFVFGLHACVVVLRFVR